VRFDQLVIAIGSVANHFGVPGAAEHTISLMPPRTPNASA
jgi:NADH dehydrogenase